jgi:hypothetical protein
MTNTQQNLEKFLMRKRRGQSFKETFSLLTYTDAIRTEVKVELLHFILACYGMTFILVHGKIFEDLRPKKDYTKKWNTLFHCPLCMGFWVGVFMWAINGFTELFMFEYSLINAFLCGCISAGTSYILSMLVDDFGFRNGVKNDQEELLD